MKRCRKSAPAVTPAYMAAWSKLFARSPAELEAEKQARQPAPAPQPPGSRKNARQGPKSATERTQADVVRPVQHSPEKPPCRRHEPYSSGTDHAIYLQEICPMNFIHDDQEEAE